MNPMTVAIPVALTFLLPAEQGQEPKKIHIPEGTLLEVDESTNLCILGGFLPDDPKVNEFQNDNGSTAKSMTFRLANKRVPRNATGGYGDPIHSSRMVKVRGQAVQKAEDLRSGARVVIAGFLQTDKTASKREGKEFDYFDHCYTRDLHVISIPKGEKRAAAAGGEAKAPTRKKAAASALKVA